MTIYLKNKGFKTVFELLVLVFAANLSFAEVGPNWIEQWGIRWTFDKNISTDRTAATYQYGTFANGDYWIIGPVSIIEINPPSTEISGRIKNGSEINPIPSASNELQGYDNSMLRLDYAASLNVALDVSVDNPLTVATSSSLISTISYSDAGAHPQLQTAAILTVLSSVPADGSFRPPYCGTDKTIKFNKSDLDYSSLGKLKPTASAPSLATAERYFERPWLDYKRGTIAQDELHPYENMPGYGRDISARMGAGALALQLDYSDAQKETLMIRFVQLGIDNFGVVENGGTQLWRGDGGHGHGRKWPILFAGIVLDDADMKAIGDKSGDYLYSDGYGPGNIPADYIMFGEDTQTFYVKEADVYNQPYSLSSRGLCGEAGTVTVTQGSAIVIGSGSNFTKTYNGSNAQWFGVVNDNQAYLADGHAYRIASIQSDTQLTLDTNYTGATASKMSYKTAVDLLYYGHGNESKKRDYEEYVKSHLGLPEWGIEHESQPKTDGYDWDASYRTSCSANSWAGSVLSAHIMGAKTLWSHNALFDYMDRYMQLQADAGLTGNWTRQWDDFTEEMWDAYRADYGPVWPDTRTTSTFTLTVNSSETSGVPISSSTGHGGTTSYTKTIISSTSVNLQAPPYVGSGDSRYRFTGWSGDVDTSDTTNPITLKMDRDKDITANFIADPVSANDLLSSPVTSLLSEMTFNAANTYEVISTENWNLAGNTITLWINPENFTGSQYIFGHTNPDSWKNRIQLYLTDASLGVGLGDTHFLQTDLATLQTGQWYFISLSWDGVNYIVKVNDLIVGSGIYTGLDTIQSSSDLGNNGMVTDRAEPFFGIIDDVRVYNRVLTSEETDALYNYGRTSNNNAPVLETIGNKSIPEDKLLTFTLSATDPDGDTIEYIAQNLPPEAAMVTKNTFEWKPTYEQANTYNVTFIASDGQLQDSETIEITVNNVNRPPVLSTISDQSIDAGQTLTFTVSASDPDGNSLTYLATPLPAGASFENKTFTWKPENIQEGVYTIDFIVSDTMLSHTRSVTITVLPSLDEELVNSPLVDWKLTETSGTTAHDFSEIDGSYDAQLVNDPAWTADAEGVSFDGLHSYMEVADSNTLAMTGPTTFSMWIRINTYTSWAKLFIKPHSAYAAPWEMFTVDLSSSGDRPRFVVTDGILAGSAAVANANTTINASQWYHIVATYDGSSIGLYLDGQLQATRPVNFTIGSNTMPLSIGGRLGNNSFDGNMSDIRIYDDCLNNEEVQLLYSYGRSQPENLPPVSEDDSFTVLQDSTDNTLSVLDNDTDPEGDTITITSVTQPAHGIAVVTNSGTAINYTPIPGYDKDAFNYTISDGNGGTSSSDVSLTINSSTLVLSQDSILNNPAVNWKLIEGFGNEARDFAAADGFSNAQRVNDPVWTTNGDGLTFNGLYSHLEIPDSDGLELTGPTTFSMWVRLNEYRNWAKIFIKPHSLYALPWEMYAIDLGSTGDRPRFTVTDGIAYGDATAVSSSHTLDLNQWHHIVGTYDGSSIRLYLDGQWEGTRDVNFDIGTNSMPLSIGGRLGRNTLSGNMSNIRIYDACLSDEQIERLYDRGRNDKLTAHFALDDNFTTHNTSVVNDSSGINTVATAINDPNRGDAWAEEYCRIFRNTKAIEIDSTAMTPEAGTIAMLVTPEDNIGFQFLFGHSYLSANQIFLYTVSGQLAMILGTNAEAVLNIAELQPNATYHVALTWNGTSYAVYVDGSQRSAGTFPGLTALGPIADIANIGIPASRSNGMGFDGVIDDVCVYNRALSADEVVALSNAQQIKENRQLVFDIYDEDGSGNQIFYAVDESTLPSNALFDADAQTLTWTPWYDQAGDYQILFTPGNQSEPLEVAVSVQDVARTDDHLLLFGQAPLQ